ncbi:MAG: low affinity iron permease family protein [Pyrinomonadaceae bacterium]
MNDHSTSLFTRLARFAATVTGRPITFITAVLIIIGWAILGPLFGFSDTWQLVINTGTTIVTFLMVFLIQNTQNRDTEALQIKLDELIRANTHARNALLDLEQMDEKELDEIRQEYLILAEETRKHLEKRRK